MTVEVEYDELERLTTEAYEVYGWVLGISGAHCDMDWMRKELGQLTEKTERLAHGLTYLRIKSILGE